MKQRNDIQGLRAVAVLAVMAFHISSDWLPGGFIGVDVFLVLSGYLITKIILAQKESGSFSYYQFILSRIRRIIPAYMVLVSVTAFSMSFLLIPNDFSNFIDSFKSALWFNSNNYFADHYDYFGSESYEYPLLHTWSLAVEMQFYLIFPFFIMLVPPRIMPLALVVVLTLFTGYSTYLLYGNAGQSVYYSLAARIPEFMIGALLALSTLGKNWSHTYRNVVSAIGLSMVAASFFFITDNDPFPGVLALPACLGVVLIIAARSSYVNRVLEATPFVLIGALSYSLYLWHWPILAATRYFMGSYSLSTSALILVMLSTVLCSYISYRVIELPFRRRSNFVVSGWPPYAVLVLSVLASLNFYPKLNSSLVPSIPKEQSRYANISEICHNHIVGDCIRGEPESKKEILVIGDSHAAQLNYFADVVGDSLHVSFRVITASGCITIPGFDASRLPEKARLPCINQTKKVESYFSDSDGIILAGKWVDHYQSPNFLSVLSDFLSDQRIVGKQVLILSQVPMLTANTQRVYRFKHLNLDPQVQLSEQGRESNRFIRKLAGDYSNTTYFDSSDIELFSTPPFWKGKMMYLDSHHLNEIGSRLYGEAAEPYIADWLANVGRL